MEEKRSEKWMFAAACFAGSAAYILMKLEVGVVPEEKKKQGRKLECVRDNARATSDNSTLVLDSVKFCRPGY